MRPSIVFGILSAAHRPDTLQQLVRALADYPVVVHHDFSQQPDFRIDEPNVTFVSNYARTGWASWGLMDSITRTIRFCGEQFQYDYLQFLSPVDLPIRPLADFEALVAADDHDVAVDVLDMNADELVFMTFAFRAYAAENSLPYRLMWHAREAYFGDDYRTTVRGGLAVPTDASRRDDGKLTLGARCGRSFTTGLVRLVRRFGNPIMRSPVMAGSAWFGGRRDACDYLVEKLEDPVVLARFKPVFCAPEMLISTVFAQSAFRRRPGNHVINEFDGARPLWFGPEDYDRLVASGQYFARKFPDDPTAAIRLRMLERIRVDPFVPCVA